MTIKAYDKVSRIALVHDERNGRYLAVRMQDKRHYNKVIQALGSDLTKAIRQYLPHCRGMPLQFVVRRKVKPTK